MNVRYAKSCICAQPSVARHPTFASAVLVVAGGADVVGGGPGWLVAAAFTVPAGAGGGGQVDVVLRDREWGGLRRLPTAVAVVGVEHHYAVGS